jgi:hypothetical protein
MITIQIILLLMVVEVILHGGKIHHKSISTITTTVGAVASIIGAGMAAGAGIKALAGVAASTTGVGAAAGIEVGVGIKASDGAVVLAGAAASIMVGAGIRASDGAVALTMAGDGIIISTEIPLPIIVDTEMVERAFQHVMDTVIIEAEMIYQETSGLLL